MDSNQAVASYADEVAGITARAEQAKEQIKNLAGTATSPDGAVTVTVNGSGSLRDISFGERADELPRTQLASAIMATARRAQAQASQQILAIMAPLVGEDSDAMRFVREQLPSTAEPEQQAVERAYPGQPDVDDEPPGEPLSRHPTRPAPSHVDDDDFEQDSPLSREQTW